MDINLTFGGKFVTLQAPVYTCTECGLLKKGWQGVGVGGKARGGVFFVSRTVETSVLLYIKIVMVSAACDQDIEP